MSTFLANILRAVDGDESKILAFTFNGPFTSYYWKEDNPEATKDQKGVPLEIVNNILTWQEAKPFTDYIYDAGYGAMDCHDIIFWTADRVYFIHEYDGSTSITWVPRNPENFVASSN